MWFKEFQDGGHVVYQNGTILAILKVHVPLMLPKVSTQSELSFRRRCRLKKYKMAAKAANLYIGTERFYQF